MRLAGVYITEEFVDIIVGDLDSSLLPEVGISMPRTKNRKQYRFERGRTKPHKFLEFCAEWLAKNFKNIQSVVVACFGTFKTLDNSTIKPNQYINYGVLSESAYYKDWSNVHVFHIFKGEFAKQGVSVFLKVFANVDSAAYGEFWLRSRSSNNYYTYYKDTSLVYLNVSRTISCGITKEGKTWKKPQRMTLGAMKIKRWSGITTSGNYVDDEFRGTCPIHNDCINGLLGIDAIEQRIGMPFDEIPNDSTLWNMIAYYVAQLCVIVANTIKPSQIVLGGRSTKEQEDREFAEKFLSLVRWQFYNSLSNVIGSFDNIDYRDIEDKESFISLPWQPMKKDGSIRRAMPGVHGALRMAASNAYILQG